MVIGAWLCGWSTAAQSTSYTDAEKRFQFEEAAVPNLYQTSRESKTLELEDTSRDGFPVRVVLTLRKLGAVTMLDYFLSPEEAEGIVSALRKSASRPG